MWYLNPKLVTPLITPQHILFLCLQVGVRTVKYLTFFHCMGPNTGMVWPIHVGLLCFFFFLIWFNITIALNYSLGSKSHFSLLFSFCELERIETVYKKVTFLFPSIYLWRSTIVVSIIKIFSPFSSPFQRGVMQSNTQNHPISNTISLLTEAQPLP